MSAERIKKIVETPRAPLPNRSQERLMKRWWELPTQPTKLQTFRADQEKIDLKKGKASVEWREEHERDL